ncbi:MAG: hypothetical protein ACFB21_04010 [Opitutales bacterium]
MDSLPRLRWMTGALALLLLVLAAGGALTISGLRRSIARSAEESARLERLIAEQRRENENRASQIARVHSPEFLQAHIPPGLRPIEEDQVIYLPLEAPAPPEPELVPSATVAQQSPRSISFELPILGATTSGSRSTSQ